MDLKKWEHVVLEWVNCLKLSEPIKSLNDLRNGAFFVSLVKVMALDESPSQETCLTAVTQFLRKQYPNFSFQSDSNLEGLLEIDLLVIASLLLHYTCIHDRRDILTSPLCNKLSKTTQICIKTFLESIKNETTKEEFFEALEQLVSRCTKPKTLHALTIPSAGSSSPLQGLLLTPPSKLVRLQEKEKEISELQTVIDLERYEKLDLQDELHLQKERNKKLSKQVGDKTSEIIRLRSEILELESKSLPHSQDDESRELQCRLRGEISSLECYIQQLQNEQEQLYMERDTMKDKLRKIEGQYIIWHDKTLSTEKDFDSLLEKHQQQETELHGLRVHCMELSALLEEMRATKRCNESVADVDTSVDTPCEDLACAVVEVQLRDAQKENAELRGILKDSQESAKKLNEDLGTVRKCLEELQGDYEFLKADNEDLLEKASLLTETQAVLLQTRQELEKSAHTVCELSVCKESLTSEIGVLQQHLNKTKATLAEVENANSSLSNTLKLLRDDYTNLQESLNDKSSSCDALECEINAIQAQYNELLEKYSKTNFAMQALGQSLEQIEHAMEENLLKLEQFAFGSSGDIDVKDQGGAFVHIFSQLEKKFEQQSDDKNDLLSRIADFEELVTRLKLDLSALTERDVINLQERQTLYNNLKCAEQKISILEDAISSYVEKIQEMTTTISNMSSTISELELLKQVIERKESLISDKEATNCSLQLQVKTSSEELAESRTHQEELQKSMAYLEGIKGDFEAKIAELERKAFESRENEDKLNKTIVELQALTCVFEGQILQKADELSKCKQSQENLQRSHEDLKYQLFEANNKVLRQQSEYELLEKDKFEQERQFQETIKVLNVEIEGYQVRANELEMELQSSQLNCAAAQRDLETVQDAKQMLQEEMETCRSDFDKRVAVLEKTIKNLDNSIQVAAQRESDLQEKFDAKVKECFGLQQETIKNIARCTSLEQELQESLETLKIKQQECREQSNLISQNSQELLVVKLDAEEKKEQLLELGENIEKSTRELKSLEEQVVALDLQNKELWQQSGELRSERSLLQNLKETLETKCEELEANSLKINNELSSKKEQLDDLVKQYKLHQDGTEAEIAHLKASLEKSNGEVKQLKEVKDTLVVEKEREIETLEANMVQLNVAIESMNRQEAQYVGELHCLKDELSDTIMKYTEALQTRQETEAESEEQISNLTKNLHEVVEKYNNLDKTYSDTVTLLRNTQGQLDALQNDKIELEVNLLAQQARYEQETTNLNLKISSLELREVELRSDLKETTQNLEMAESTVGNLSDDLRKVQKEKTCLYQSLSSIGITCKDLKNTFATLSLAHRQFVDENRDDLAQLQTKLLNQIKIQVAQNASLEDSARNLKENVEMLQNEIDVLKMTRDSEMEQKDSEIRILENEVKVCKDHISTMLAEKKLVGEHIGLERAKLEECKKDVCELQESNTAKVKEYETNIVKLESANRILETGMEILQKEISVLSDKVQYLEEVKLADQDAFVTQIEARDEQIKSLNAKIGLLQLQVLENANKNDALMLELCNVNESLDSLTKQHCKLQEVLKQEQENYTKKLSEMELAGADRQVVLQSLQAENQNKTQKIYIAKCELEKLKEKLKVHLMERQALELEMRAANEKLLGQDSVVRQQESAIAEANAKLLSKLEENLELEKAKRNLQEKVESLSIELDKAKRSRQAIVEAQAKLLKDTESNLMRAHENANEAKNDLMKRLEFAEGEKTMERQWRFDVEKLLEGEKVARGILELRVMELNNEKSKLSQVLSVLRHNVERLACILSEKPVEILVDSDAQGLPMNDIEYVNRNIEMIRERIVEVMEQNRSSITEISALQTDKAKIEHKIEEAINEKLAITQEKKQLFNDYNILCNEKIEREQELQRFKEIQITHDILNAKYEQLVEFNKNNESLNIKNVELEQKIANLERKTSEIYSTYKKFAGHSITYKIAIQKLITERNVLECVLSKLKQNLASVQMKIAYISDEREHTRVSEHVQAYEVISEDIQKQFLRISRKVHEIILMVVQIPVNVYDTVVSGKMVSSEELFEKVNFDDELEKITDCRDRTNDLLEQIATFEASINMQKITKPQKENVLRSSNHINTDIKVKDEELKKKNMMLKQRLTLAENARSNLEKKVKQLRQENKTLTERVNVDSVDSDFGYKTLLQQHIQTKQEYEETLSECRAQHNKLLKEYEEYKAKQQFIPDQIKLEKDMKIEHDIKLESELVKLRDAYSNLMSDNSKLDLDNATMRKLLENRTAQLSELKLVKEAYEKLLEENNLLRTELDTLKYKRNRDREDESLRIQEVRREYETKLEKMKDKMVQLYREEINKEILKHQTDQNEKVLLLRTIEKLKSDLDWKLERSKSDQSSESRYFESYNRRDAFFMPADCGQGRSSTSVRQPGRRLDDPTTDRGSLTRRKGLEDRKCATLPKSAGMSIIEEHAVLKRNTLSSVPSALGQNLEMEDEEDDPFNNKYLADLKEGRCVLPSGRESNASRLSELKWRNSLCPPHLKSSYPAETQFSSPGQFKDDDIKSGPAEFDDSMSTRLIPGDKPRKKDIGTTSYKKPGPPTPSKNGGRVSLQGNELHPRDVLREHNDSKTPKKATPSRLKALFMGRNSSVRDNSEVSTFWPTVCTDHPSSSQLLCDMSSICSYCCEYCFCCNILLMQRCTARCFLKRIFRNNLTVCVFLSAMVVIFFVRMDIT